ncbi:MAG: UDP-2,3-diacylglucosamine diphosphatase [Bacteroidales bacterium]|nr:UDP-2,3-diacylglucosamine diphosphatase [Bacteroidales bacterium]
MKFLLKPNKKAYFVSDLHLRMSPDEDSRRREKKFVRWLDAVKDDAGIIFLLGDIFDFWFEYRYVVPRGFVRLLGKLGELTDAGVEIHCFTGNHDMWTRDYLSVETGVTLHRDPAECTINGKAFLLGHGHGLGTVALGERLLIAVFRSRLLKRLFSNLHPRWMIAFGCAWAKSNRKRHGWTEKFDSIDREAIAVYAREQLKRKHYDFFVFGHRHLAMDVHLSEKSRYVNTGEWVNHDTFAVFDGNDLLLRSFTGDAQPAVTDADAGERAMK